MNQVYTNWAVCVNNRVFLLILCCYKEAYPYACSEVLPTLPSFSTPKLEELVTLENNKKGLTCYRYNGSNSLPASSAHRHITMAWSHTRRIGVRSGWA